MDTIYVVVKNNYDGRDMVEKAFKNKRDALLYIQEKQFMLTKDEWFELHDTMLI